MNFENVKSVIVPEDCYKFVPLTFEDIVSAKESNTPITGYVVRIVDNELIVSFGNNIIGHLPFNEVTIYEFTYSANPNNHLPLQIGTLLRKKIRVVVTDIDNDHIKLSRKSNMIKAAEYLTNCEYVFMHITNLTTKMAFGDIGDGINACLSIKYVSKTNIENISEVLHKGDKLWMRVSSYDDLNRFVVSYRDTFHEYNPNDYHEGDAVVGTIKFPTDSHHTGYFVHVTPQVCGIMDTTPLIPVLRYGQKAEFSVIESRQKGLKLKFLRLI